MIYSNILSRITRRWQPWPRPGHAPTGLPDKRQVLELIEKALAQHVSPQHIGVGLMLVHVMNHARVSATYGAQRADALMVQVGQRLEVTLGKALGHGQNHATLVIRLAQAEFAVLTDASVDAASQRRLGALLCETLNLAYALQEVAVHVNAAVGVAAGDQAYPDVQDLFQCADMAMRVAVSRGRGSLVVFERSMREALVKQQLLENDLNLALLEQQFELAFQPIMALDKLQHVGFEALARWQHPVRGCLLPRDFLDVAEDAELICRLDWQVIGLALRAMADWRVRQLWRPGWFVSVNLSAQHFKQPGFCETLLGMMQSHGISPQDLHLELTESAFMQNLPVARGEMTRLRQHGFELYMDDFGTGYSSLSHLHALPFSAIKIDKCFLDPMVHDFEQTSLMSTMVRMGQLLGIKVVAEGLETLEQLSVLQRLQCEYAQGHLMSAAMNHDMASTWLQAVSDPIV